MKRVKFSIYSLLFFLLIFSSLSPIYAQRKKRGGGGLAETAKTAKTGPQIIPNIHMQLGCEVCHIGRPKEDEKEAKLLTNNDNVVELCLSCHEGADHHKVNVDPKQSAITTASPAFLPLGKYGVSKDKLVCTTCHLPHVELASNSLLRGFALQENERDAPFAKRLDLCASCHGKEFIAKSPHTGDEKLCGFCHSGDPTKAKDVMKETIKRDIVDLCDFCHGSMQGGHFLEVNAFSDKSIRKDFPTSIPLVDGAVTCTSCHDPHGKSKNLYLLRSEFIDFAVKSKEINVHEKRVFCMSCHDQKPEAGKQATIKFGNDIDMCNWCHKVSEESIGHHPIGALNTASIALKMDKNLPLKDGKHTCLTCHERKFECENTELKEKISVKNPNYLIGGPYTDKNGLCYRCHIKDELMKIDPHKMMDDKGNVIASQCKYCHSLPAEKLKEGNKDVGLIGNPVFLCLLCHSDRDHPGTKRDGSGAKHLVKFEYEKQRVVQGKVLVEKNVNLKPLKDIPFDRLPINSDGQITCSTCHQVHQAGLLKNEKNKSTGDKPMWRMSVDNLCTACHPW